MRKKSGKSTTILLVLLLLVGLSVMLYPTISDWWNSKTQSRAVATYQKAANDLSDKENEEILSRARKYNEEIAKLARPFVDYDQVKGYEVRACLLAERTLIRSFQHIEVCRRQSFSATLISLQRAMSSL